MQDDRPHEGGVYRGGSIATDLRVLYSLGPVDFRGTKTMDLSMYSDISSNVCFYR